jgi:MSHA biogenesis protein MshL
MLRMTGTTYFASTATLFILLTGCAQQPPLKSSPTHITAEVAPAGNIPAAVQVPVILPRPKATPKPETYSVVVNNVRVQELLFALARDAKINVDIHPGIAGNVTLNAIDQTLQQLLTRVAKQVDMRWELDGPNLMVMPDSPYLRIYKVDYVNMERNTSGSVGVSSQVGGAGGGGGGGGGSGSNASTTTVRNVSNNRFWETLVDNIQDILRETDKVLPAGAPNPAAAATQASQPQQSQQGTTPPGGQQGGQAPVTTPGTTNTGPTFREAASVIANRETGLISIRATSRQHEKIQEFLDRDLANAKRQVLIEATIVEVRLNNQYQQGIDWSILRRGPAGLNLTQSAGGTGTQASVNSQALTIGIADPRNALGNVTATIKLLDSFGDVKVLSSPKMSVLNNQTALLKVVDNLVYFTISANTTQGSTGVAVTTFTTTPQVVPVGFVMNVTPQISDDDTVLLNVKPSVTRVISTVDDPNPALSLLSVCGNPPPVGCSAVKSSIPVVQTREMESILKINSGQIAVLGGLIQDSMSDLEDSTPGVNRVPGIRNLFLNNTRQSQKTELVVFMRPIVVKDPSIDGDYRSYRTYLPDEDFMARPNPGKPVVE